MKIKRFKIPIYEYNVIYVELSGSSKEEDEMKVLLEGTKLNLPKKDIKNICKEIKLEYINGGDHFSNLSRKISVIVIFHHNNAIHKKATIAHEKRHLEDRILKHYYVNDSESAGLLSGWLARKIP